jgi:hypothetical protein
MCRDIIIVNKSALVCEFVHILKIHGENNITFKKFLQVCIAACDIYLALEEGKLNTGNQIRKVSFQSFLGKAAKKIPEKIKSVFIS